MKKSKFLVSSLAILLALAAALSACSGKKDDKDKNANKNDEVDKNSITEKITTSGQSFSGSLNIKSVGQVVTLGKYEQDNDTANGAEDIEWVVVDIQGDYALVLSKNVLDAMEFGGEVASWESSDIRKWLGNDFLNSSFGADEKNRICTIEQDGVEDRVFLLSFEEAEKYFENDIDRMAIATDYAYNNGVFVSSGYTEDDAVYNGSCRWWLRTVDEGGNTAQRVRSNGELLHVGYDISADDIGVRPAMWIEKK